ncbi:type II toxin-antitoxin system VapC family toxin [uncultured Microbacterium sp.]|uniref:type II toxin-antitoxin system VapC family toxin n=1 Tax=uncultured Microbacterium sp. TaxID=191216 RepID=UPI00261B4C4B|nr:type II toxin-antitoxin system VapC family toxin [uncultured Microbacterium sp.]
MIVLDTNVLSELMQPEPHPAVISWLDSVPRSEVCTSAITVAEIAAGIAVLPKGKRRTRLEQSTEAMLEAFAGRILPFTARAALHYGAIIAARKDLGRPISVADAEIAAIAVDCSGTVATRNIRDFEGTGARIIDPWLAGE